MPPDPVSSTSPSPRPQADHRWLEVVLGLATAPLMLGLVAAQSTGKWLQDLKMSEQSWWSEQRLPPLDPQALQDRQARLQDRSPSTNTAPAHAAASAPRDPAEEETHNSSPDPESEVNLEN